jgi:FkbM family methyltransferase
MQLTFAPEIHIKQPYGYKYAVITSGTMHDHATGWTHDDEQSVRDRWWHIKPGEVVLDGGAAFGSYCLSALAMGARVVAFSPAELDTIVLAKNLTLNPDLAQRCLLVRDGLHEADGWFDSHDSKFYPDPQTEPRTADDNGRWLRVRALDSFLEERPGIDRVDWLKLDVEGAELGVLRGAEQMLRRHRPKLLIELHQFHVSDMPQQVAAYLASLNLGYCVDGPVPHCAVSHALYVCR